MISRVSFVFLILIAGFWVWWGLRAATDGNSVSGSIAPLGVVESPIPQEPNTIVDRVPPLTGPARRAAELRLALDLRSAMISLRERSMVDDPLLYTAHDEIRGACSLVHRPDVASPRVDLDPNRRPWLDALQARCAGLDPQMLEPLPVADPAALAWSTQVPERIAASQGKSAAVAHSLALLRESIDARLLHEALRYALLEEQLPLADIFSGVDIPVREDLELALLNAADWIACRRSYSCGSDGLWTLYTCAQFGCAPNTDLATALRHLLPLWHYEASRRVMLWVVGLS